MCFDFFFDEFVCVCVCVRARAGWRRYKSPYAKYLTMMQLAQFFTGIALATGVQFLGTSCERPAGLAALTALQVYGAGLIALFFAFFQKKYKAD
jgi:hypothetical protein